MGIHVQLYKKKLPEIQIISNGKVEKLWVKVGGVNAQPEYILSVSDLDSQLKMVKRFNF